MKYNVYMLYNGLKQISRNFEEELNIFLAQSFFNKKKKEDCSSMLPPGLNWCPCLSPKHLLWLYDSKEFKELRILDQVGRVRQKRNFPAYVALHLSPMLKGTYSKIDSGHHQMTKFSKTWVRELPLARLSCSLGLPYHGLGPFNSYSHPSLPLCGFQELCTFSIICWVQVLGEAA